MKLSLALFLFLLATISYAKADESVTVQKTAQMFVAAFNSSDPARIEREFNPEMRKAITSEQLAKFLSDIKSEYGKILRLQSPQVTATTGNFQVIFEKAR